MPAAAIRFFLADDEATARLGRWFAPRLRGGDTLLLEGPIGAGKSHLARALIRGRLGREEEVPSPTFTLVQTYEAEGVEIWHADLYRLSHPGEVSELGLEAAFADSICLVEWPDRLGGLVPADALHLRLDIDGDGRRVTIMAGESADPAHHAQILGELVRDWGPDEGRGHRPLPSAVPPTEGGAAQTAAPVPGAAAPVPAFLPERGPAVRSAAGGLAQAGRVQGDAPGQTRDDLSRAFLVAAGWGGAERRFLAGDASDRSYDRLTRQGETAVLMDAPPGRGDDPATFLAIADHLHALGLSAPRCLARDLDHGFLLLEDLGNGIYARLVEADRGVERPLYSAATDVLAHLQAHAAPGGLADLSAAEWAEAACFAPTFYAGAAAGTAPDTRAFREEVSTLLTRHADGPRVLILRDYHAENLLWLPDRAGLARVGLLDFQLAQMGQPGYDLVSLLQDARRDVAPETEAAMVRHFIDLTGAEEAAFARAYAVLGAQRALRILGIFARLCTIGGKPHYLRLVPRVWAQLRRNLGQPGLERLARICAAILPAPTPSVLARIEMTCPTPK